MSTSPKQFGGGAPSIISLPSAAEPAESPPVTRRTASFAGIQRALSRPIDPSMLTSAHTFLGERTYEQDVVVPKKVTREEVYEKVMVVPERRIVEDVEQDTVRIRERIIEVGKPVVQERLVEIPEVEYIPTTCEFTDTVHEEKVSKVARVQLEKVEKIEEKIVTVEKIVEVPEIVEIEIPVEKIVEVPEYQDEVIIKEVAMDQYVECPIYQDKLVQVTKDVERKIPVPIEVVSEWHFRVPMARPQPQIQKIPIYVPRFIEVPVPSAFLSEGELADAKEIYAVMRRIASNPVPSLCEIEKLAEVCKERQGLIRKPTDEEAMNEVEAKLRQHIEASAVTTARMQQKAKSSASPTTPRASWTEREV